MPVEIHVHDAAERVEYEREAVDEKRTAYERFLDSVADVPAESVASRSADSTTALGQPLSESSSSGGCRAVRRAFAETVRPHSVADVDGDEALLATIRHELGESVALALAPTTDAPLSPQVRSAVVEGAEARKTGAEALSRALEREATDLRRVMETVESVTDWIETAEETPLSALGFDALAARHGALADHREACDARARERQSFLDDSTGSAAAVAVEHRSLLPYLYQDLPHDHPALTTLARLDDVCASCQRTVRDHLVRRV
jgi:hypothetical protein